SLRAQPRSNLLSKSGSQGKKNGDSLKSGRYVPANPRRLSAKIDRDYPEHSFNIKRDSTSWPRARNAWRRFIMSNDNLTSLDVILKKQRAAFMQEGAPSLAQRQSDLNRLKTAVLSRRRELEIAADTDFGHRTARETVILDIVPLVQGINHLRRNTKA